MRYIKTYEGIFDIFKKKEKEVKPVHMDPKNPEDVVKMILSDNNYYKDYTINSDMSLSLDSDIRITKTHISETGVPYSEKGDTKFRYKKSFFSL